MTENEQHKPLTPTELIEKYQIGIWRYLRVLGCEASLAEDITQETFLKILRKGFDQYNDAATAGFLRKVAYNLFVSVQRRSGRVVLVENIDQLDAIWDRWAGSDNGDDTIDKLRDCMEALSDRARDALEMRFREKQTRIKIAEFLEITEHGAKNLMQRAKKQLRECVENKIQAEAI